MTTLAPLALAAALAVAPESGPRPNFDAFFEASSASELLRSPLALELEAAGQVAHREPHTRVPSFYWAMRLFDRAPEWAGQGLSSVEAARRYLYLYAPLWGFAPTELAGAALDGTFALANGAQVVRFSRQVDGVPVFRDGLALVLTAEQGLVAISGFLLPHAPSGVPFALRAETALAAAAADARLFAPAAGDLAAQDAPGPGWQRFTDTKERLHSARAQGVVHPAREARAGVAR
jgi:hypothetical protein